jgi:hypothetical protein
LSPEPSPEPLPLDPFPFDPFPFDPLSFEPLVPLWLLPAFEPFEPLVPPFELEDDVDGVEDAGGDEPATVPGSPLPVPPSAGAETAPPGCDPGILSAGSVGWRPPPRLGARFGLAFGFDFGFAPGRRGGADECGDTAAGRALAGAVAAAGGELWCGETTTGAVVPGRAAVPPLEVAGDACEAAAFTYVDVTAFVFDDPAWPCARARGCAPAWLCLPELTTARCETRAMPAVCTTRPDVAEVADVAVEPVA